ncbi:transcriptional regulator [Pseudomonas chlororaphis]|uniref:transcriptional regulator n=1 Tax=Pseudomonas chlororaphis TaxID=587753 RepID=UPI000B4460E7|nr:YdaS family helix-turn-helix protein [Pseudomonas chlororaphis]
MASSPLERAIAVAGSGVALANAIGASPMCVSHWKARGIPARHVVKIESVTGVSRHELRPDLYPEPSPTLTETIRPISATGQSTGGAGDPSSAAQASP